MIQLLLAASILGSVPAAVEKTLSTPRACFGLEEPDAACLSALQEPVTLVTMQEHLDAINAMEIRLKFIEEVADTTASCIREAFILAGGDLMSTAANQKWCPDCEEGNIFGFAPEARVAMKIGQLGVQIDQCYRAAKNGKKANGVVTWANRGIQGFAIVTNIISAITGKPLFTWPWRKPDDTLPVVASFQKGKR
jgi:hypothetical protein